MKPSLQHRELVSSLADGQLAGDEFAAALDVCQQDTSALADWNSYHLIGDVLRAPASVVLGADPAFLERLNRRLAQEPARTARLHSAGLGNTDAPATGATAPGPVPRRAASNDANLRWKLVAGFASLAAVAAIAWNAAGVLAPVAGPQLAQGQSSQVLVASPQGTMVRDARLEELLAAHKQQGGTSALQVPSGFLRNATFEASQDAGR